MKKKQIKETPTSPRGQEEDMTMKAKILSAIKAEDIIEQIEEDGVFAIRYRFQSKAGEMHGYTCIIADATLKDNGTNKVFGGFQTSAEKAIPLSKHIQSTKDSGSYAAAKEA